MGQRTIQCPECPAMFWTERSRDSHLEEVDHQAKAAASEWTKVNVRRDLVEQVKVRAATENRTITNYIETLILKELSNDK